MKQLLVASLALAIATWGMGAMQARAAVDDVAANGFSVTETEDITAAPTRVYDALIAPARWWNPEHTYSQDAANLALDARAGGCWCETLPGGGSVQHLVVVNAMPGKMLRLRGALGPLQSLAVDGALTFSLRPIDHGTHLTMSYTVGGYLKPAAAELAKAVDSVLGEQANRLKHFIETGMPAIATPNEPRKGSTP